MSARYINIDDKFIVELSNSTIKKDWFYDIVTNTHTNEKSFYVSYQHDTETNSTRDNGIERLGKFTNNWIYLDVNTFKANTGLVYENDIIPILDLPYNVIKIHMLAGYTMEDYNGFTLNAYVNDVRNTRINLLNFAFIKDFPNENIEFSPEPLYINSRYYNRFIELHMISPEYFLQPTDYQFLLDKLSNNAIDNKTLINFEFSYIINIDEYITTGQTIKRAETLTDNYKYFGLRLEEVQDYFELYATYKGGFPSEFIDKMATLNRQWILTHKLEVFEQLGFSMVKTSEVEMIQRSNFNKPMKFRPIIENANNAYSFSIKYTCIFRDITTNEQFYRVANLSKLNPKKYGESILKLNVSNIQPINLYNKQDPSVILQFNGINNLQEKTLVVNHYLREIPIVDNTNITIEPFTNVYAFNFNSSIAEGFEFFLAFVSDDNEKLYISDIEEQNSDTSLFFKITEQQATQIKRFSNKTFYIIGVNTNGESTVIHKGGFN